MGRPSSCKDVSTVAVSRESTALWSPLFVPPASLIPSPRTAPWVLAALPMHTQPRGLGNSEPLSIRAQSPLLFVEYSFIKQPVPLLRKAFLHVLSSVVCPPGTSSPPKASQCSPCPVGTYSPIYGVAFCTPCKDGMITRVPGASSMTDCIKKERTKQGTQIIYY